MLLFEGAVGPKVSLKNTKAKWRSREAWKSSPRLCPSKRVFLNLPGDQKAIWTAPFHLRFGDASWLLPRLRVPVS